SFGRLGLALEFCWAKQLDADASAMRQRQATLDRMGCSSLGVTVQATARLASGGTRQEFLPRPDSLHEKQHDEDEYGLIRYCV
ncbi:MAG: hypothetical protein AAF394_14240, partial [Planctomycetota bacterium]